MCQWYSEVYDVVESYGNPFILFLYSRPHLPGCPSGLTCCRTETFAFSVHAYYFDHLQFAWNGLQEVPPRGSLVFPWSQPLLYHRITSSTQFWTEAGIWVAKHTTACASRDMFGWGWSSGSQSPESWTVLIKWRVGGDNKYYNNMIINQRLKPGREMIWWKVGIWRRQLRGWGAKEQKENEEKWSKKVGGGGDSVRNRHGVRSGGGGGAMNTGANEPTSSHSSALVFSVRTADVRDARAPFTPTFPLCIVCVSWCATWIMQIVSRFGRGRSDFTGASVNATQFNIACLW